MLISKARPLFIDDRKRGKSGSGRRPKRLARFERGEALRLVCSSGAMAVGGAINRSFSPSRGHRISVGIRSGRERQLGLQKSDKGRASGTSGDSGTPQSSPPRLSPPGSRMRATQRPSLKHTPRTRTATGNKRSATSPFHESIPYILTIITSA